MNKKRTLSGFFGWLDLANFFDVYQEWHAFVEGFCEVMCPWPARYGPSEELLKDLKDEHHYYMWGRAVGILGWLTIGCVIKEVFF
jgi:hypothetical protein